MATVAPARLGIKIKAILEMAMDYELIYGVHPTRLTVPLYLWDDFRKEILWFQRGTPLQLFGMDIAISPSIDYFEVSDEQRLLYTPEPKEQRLAYLT